MLEDAGVVSPPSCFRESFAIAQPCKPCTIASDSVVEKFHRAEGSYVILNAGLDVEEIKKGTTMNIRIPIALVSLLVTASPAATALECSSPEGVTLTWEKRAKGTTAEGADHIAKVNWGTQGFEHGECVPVSRNAEATRYSCHIQPEWNRFESAALIDMEHSQAKATIRKLKADRRMSAGYRIEASYNLQCGQPSTTAVPPTCYREAAKFAEQQAEYDYYDKDGFESHRCELAANKKAVICEVSAAKGDGAATDTYRVVLNASCSKAHRVELIGEE